MKGTKMYVGKKTPDAPEQSRKLSTPQVPEHWGIEEVFLFSGELFLYLWYKDFVQSYVAVKVFTDNTCYCLWHYTQCFCDHSETRNSCALEGEMQVIY